MATFSRKQLQSGVTQYTNKERELHIELEAEIIKSEVLQYSNSGQFYSLARVYYDENQSLLEDITNRVQEIFPDCEVKFVQAQPDKVECINESFHESYWVYREHSSEDSILQYINVYWGDEELEKKFKEEHQELEKKFEVVDKKLRELYERQEKENSKELEKLVRETDEEYRSIRQSMSYLRDKLLKFEVKTD